MKEEELYDSVNREAGRDRLSKRDKEIKDYLSRLRRLSIGDHAGDQKDYYIDKKNSLNDALTKIHNFIDTRNANRNTDDVLSVEDIKKLEKLYKNAISYIDSITGYLREVVSNSRATNKKYYRAWIDENDVLANDLAKDLAAITNSLKENEPKSLRGIYESSRIKSSYKVKKTYQARKTKGGILNQRIPVTIINDQKEEVEGFFTVDNIPNIIAENNKKMKKIKKAYAGKAEYINRADLRTIYDDFYDNNNSGIVTILTAKPEELLSLEYDEVIDEFASIYKNGKKVEDEEYDWIRQYIPGPVELKAFIELASLAFKEFNQTGINKDLGISAKSRVNRRNAAMSKVAETLGLDDLIAKSENVMLNIDGKNLKGTFMRKAKGFDSNSRDNNSPFFKSSAMCIEGLNLKKNVADMQILDYICGNPDRHRGNILYNYKELEDGRVELESIQGIDNDTCFGSKPYINIGMSSVMPEQMKVITKDTYNRLANLSPETLKHILYGFDLTSAEVDNAIERLLHLKKKIYDDSLEYEKGYAKGYLIEGRIKIVDDEELAMLSTTVDLGRKRKTIKGNTFDKIIDNTDGKKAMKEHADAMRREYLSLVYKTTVSSLPEYSDLVDMLKSDTSVFRGGSAGYTQMLEDMKLLKDQIMEFSECVVGKNVIVDGKHAKSLMDLKENIRQVLITTNEYIGYKDNKETGEEWRNNPNPHKPGRTERRYKNAIKIREFLNKQLDIFEELDHTHDKWSEFRRKEKELKKEYQKCNDNLSQHNTEMINRSFDIALNNKNSRTLYSIKQYFNKSKNTYERHYEIGKNRFQYQYVLGFGVNAVDSTKREELKKNIESELGIELPSDEMLLKIAVCSSFIYRKLDLAYSAASENTTNVILNELSFIHTDPTVNYEENIMNSPSFNKYFEENKDKILKCLPKGNLSISIPSDEMIDKMIQDYKTVYYNMYPNRQDVKENKASKEKKVISKLDKSIKNDMVK
ncbi:MAG: hypothetical protein K5656_02405 [Lachnospiraceae bacterium]|nr:hypothetical protein [Lachnospiraceae bacterium]